MSVRIGSIVWDTASPNYTKQVVGDIWEAYRLEEGEFLLQSFHGYTVIGRLTGRTARFHAMDCPTIERFEVDTYADEAGVVLGRRGNKIYGTLATRPENVA